MLRIKRNERVVAMTRILSSHPNKIFTLNYFSEFFYSAKSTICEDVAIIRDTFLEFKLGDLETVAGAAGGVKFIPLPSKLQSLDFIKNLCETLSQPDRILPGGFLYINDIIYMPQIIQQLGEILAAHFMDMKPDFVITVETKGTPVAVMTALSLGCPVVVARRDSNVTEGPLVSINYVTASSKRIQTMSLSKRAVKEGKKALIVDDFMKGGGTAKGLQELLKEFNIDIVGTGVVIATKDPKSKLIKNYTPLMILDQVDEVEKKIIIDPAEWIL